MTITNTNKECAVKVRLTDQQFRAMKDQAAQLGLTHSGLFGLLLMEWLRLCIKDSQQVRKKEVPRPTPDRAHFGAFARMARRAEGFGGVPFHPRI